MDMKHNGSSATWSDAKKPKRVTSFREKVKLLVML